MKSNKKTCSAATEQADGLTVTNNLLFYYNEIFKKCQEEVL